MNKNDLTECFHLIAKDFILDEKVSPIPDTSGELESKVRKVVQDLLNKDFEKLLLVLYRIDVSEQKVKEVLANEKPDNLAKALADLIISRELQKIETRRKYSQ